MKENSLEERLHITESIQKIVRSNVKVSEKCIETIHYARQRDYVTTRDLLKSMIVVSPAVSCILSTAGINVQELSKDFRLKRNCQASPSAAIEYALCGRDAYVPWGDFAPTEQTIESVNRGVITEFDFLQSFIESGQLADGIGAYGEIAYYSNAPKKSFIKIKEMVKESLIMIHLLEPDFYNPKWHIYWDGNKFCVKYSNLCSFAFHKKTVSSCNVADFTHVVSNDCLLELETLINNNASENDFQFFFENYPGILCGEDYQYAIPQVVLERENSGQLIPDFILKRKDSVFVDLLDLKLPQVTPVKYPVNREGFRAAVYDAVHQLRSYRNWFDEQTNRDLFYKKYHLFSYKPKIIIVIGSEKYLRNNSDIKRLEDDLLPQYAKIWSYDFLMSRARQYIDIKKRSLAHE